MPRRTAMRPLAAGGEEDYPGEAILADQLWVLETKTGRERMLVADRQPQFGDTTRELTKTIAFIADRSLCFSPDGQRLYFITSAWFVSGALHVVDPRTGEEHFVTDANSVEIVPAGEYAGYLVVNQHRYFWSHGSYDWFWLLDPDGREVGPVGDTEEQVREFVGMSLRNSTGRNLSGNLVRASDMWRPAWRYTVMDIPSGSVINADPADEEPEP